MKHEKYYGILRIHLLLLIIIIGGLSILFVSIIGSIIYFLCAFIGTLVSIFFFCSKCSSKKRCPHIVIGIIAELFPEKHPAKHTTTEHIGASIPLLILLFTPQYFLFQNIPLLIIFWAIVLLEYTIFTKQLKNICEMSCCTACCINKNSQSDAHINRTNEN